MRRIFMLSGVLVLVVVGTLSLTRHDETPPRWVYFEWANKLFRVRWDGRQEQQLPIDYILDGGMSPDGHWVIAYDNVKGTALLHHIETSTDYPFTREYLRSYRWLPDSRTLIVIIDGALKRYDIVSHQWQTIDVPIKPDLILDVSRDGEHLLVIDDGTEFMDVYSVNIDSTDLQKYESQRFMVNTQFSPDGQWIVFSNYDEDHVYKVSLDGTDIQKLNGSQDEWVQFLMWVDNWLYYNNHSTLMRMRPDGSDFQTFMPNYFGPLPVWYGDWMLYSNYETLPELGWTTLARYNHTTGETVRLSSGPVDSTATIIPSENFKWHPGYLATGALLLGAASVLAIFRTRLT